MRILSQGQALLPHLAVAVLSLPATTSAFAHGQDAHCDAVTHSVADAGFDDVVDVQCSDEQAVLTSDTYPDHELMTGIVVSNEQIPVPAPGYQSPIPLSPVLGTEPHTRDSALGVAVNGVPIYDYTGGGEMSVADLAVPQDRNDTVLTQQLDVCGGHAGRGDDYHYHAKPVCMIAQMPNAGPDAIIGWAFDGFPIYGDLNPDGSTIAPDTLDICNGQADDTYGYRYHTSESTPYIVQCLMGEIPDIRNLPRVPPLSAVDGSRVAAGFPPPGGVENLVLVEEDSGKRSMTYTYQNEDYYITYAPSDSENCYDFATRTVTNNGTLFENELCRTSGGGRGDRPDNDRPAPRQDGERRRENDR